MNKTNFKQMLKTKTNEELATLKQNAEQHEEQFAVKAKDLQLKIKENAQQIADCVKQFLYLSISKEPVILTVDCTITRPYDWNLEEYGKFKCSFVVGFKQIGSTKDWDDENFYFSIYEKEIEASTTGYGNFKRKDRPCVPALLICQAAIWTAEIDLIATINRLVNTDLLAEHTNMRTAEYKYNYVVSDIDDELKRRADIEKKNAFIEQLKNGKYYHYFRKSDYGYRSEERWYKIVKVSEKSVKMIDIYFYDSIRYEDNDFTCLGNTHNFKLKGDVLDEMNRGYGTVVDSIEEPIAKCRKAVEEWKAAYPEEYKAWKKCNKK